MGRKVKIFEYVKSNNHKSEGESYFQKVETGLGTFQAWGVDFEQLEYGVGNFSTAIVELPDRTLQNLPVELIQFLGSE